MTYDSPRKNIRQWEFETEQQIENGLIPTDVYLGDQVTTQVSLKQITIPKFQNGLKCACCNIFQTAVWGAKIQKISYKNAFVLINQELIKQQPLYFFMANFITILLHRYYLSIQVTLTPFTFVSF